MVRYEPQDDVDWNFFNIKWIYQKTAETVSTYWTQVSSCGWEGFGHCYSLEVSYSSLAPVNFYMTFDGTTQTYQLPSTSGVIVKTFLNLQANKGKLYSFQFQSTNATPDLRIIGESFVIQAGGWSRTTPYVDHEAVGADFGVLAKV
jgi:hypothetical protein